MALTAGSQCWQTIPTKLSVAQFEPFVLPHLSTGRRDPAPTLGLHRIFNYILLSAERFLQKDLGLADRKIRQFAKLDIARSFVKLPCLKIMRVERYAMTSTCQRFLLGQLHYPHLSHPLHGAAGRPFNEYQFYIGANMALLDSIGVVGTFTFSPRQSARYFNLRRASANWMSDG